MRSALSSLVRLALPVRVALLAGVVVAATSAAVAQTGRDAKLVPCVATPGAKSINWAGSLAEAKALSDKTGKPMMIVFGADWCGYCKKLDADVLSNPQVSRYVNEGFVPVHLEVPSGVDAGNTREVRILGVQTLPCTVLLNSDADQLGRIRGFKEAGPYFQDLSAARKLQTTVRQAK